MRVDFFFYTGKNAKGNSTQAVLEKESLVEGKEHPKY